MVIEAGAAHAAITHLKAQRMNQVQRAAGVRTKAYDIAGIRRYFRFKQDNVKQSYDP